jgi:hypothetical protein
MKAVLTCRLSSGEAVEVYKGTFNLIDFSGAEIVSGDKYYIGKAISLGAIQAEKPKPVAKAKARAK